MTYSCGKTYRSIRVVVSEYGKPGKDSPQAVLLPDVVRTGTETLFSTNDGIEVLSSELSLTIHHVAEKLPSSGSFEKVQVQSSRDKIHRPYKIILYRLYSKRGEVFLK